MFSGEGRGGRGKGCCLGCGERMALTEVCLVASSQSGPARVARQSGWGGVGLAQGASEVRWGPSMSRRGLRTFPKGLAFPWSGLRSRWGAWPWLLCRGTAARPGRPGGVSHECPVVSPRRRVAQSSMPAVVVFGAGRAVGLDVGCKRGRHG
uniref:Uncharacterized protein n=1 Tax=Rousettus aegyptiacus TaxID=9407 RepID=A0A7J8C296_ROUAE|nr:hypothetical protein HJG63_009280 [Rousettus aegyptiacus]